MLDHPYAAITKADGTFTIRDLSVGEHSFVVWHEKIGYVNKRNHVIVKPGKATLETVEIPASRFDP